MPDDKKKRGGQDPMRVNVNQKWEVRTWTKHFGVSADALRTAVRMVLDTGAEPTVKAIDAVLKKLSPAARKPDGAAKKKSAKSAAKKPAAKKATKKPYKDGIPTAYPSSAIGDDA